MPIRVTLRVKRGTSLPVHERQPIIKKQRTTDVPSIHIKSEIVNTEEKGTVKTEETDGSTGSSDNAESCSFKGRVESDMYSLSNQDSENLPMHNVFSELHCEGELEYKEVAQNSTAHKRAAIPLVLNTNQKRKYQSWDERFKELVDFKKVNGHTN
eukprot:scaffold215038_cov40-Attheya_sp.AAC.5